MKYCNNINISTVHSSSIEEQSCISKLLCLVTIAIDSSVYLSDKYRLQTVLVQLVDIGLLADVF